MMSARYIEEQALDFANVPLLDRRYKASVHLENMEDELFWNRMLQMVQPGEYNFIPASRSAKGNQTSGCEQCLKYVGYLSKWFFVCIDSDLRNLVGEKIYTAKDFVAQTYFYSWENHLCHVPELQQRFEINCAIPKRPFDFSAFLIKYSAMLYRALLLFLHQKKVGNKDFMGKILSVFPKQCVTNNLENDGEGYCAELGASLAKLEKELGNPDFTEEMRACSIAGVTPLNAYLFVRGHDVYNLVASIGKTICKERGVSFERDILKTDFPTSGYLELETITQDLRNILQLPQYEDESVLDDGTGGVCCETD